MSQIKPPLISPLDYSPDVQLLDGRFKRQFDETLEFFLAIPSDDMLYGFRKRAGLPHPGNELGGWYSADVCNYPHIFDEIYNAFGQWLSFFGRAYKLTGDRRVYDKAAYLADEWAKTIEDDGYFFYTRNCNAWHYSYEKLMSGLVDLYLYAGMERARGYLEKITDWARRNLPRTRLPARNAWSRSVPNLDLVGGDPAIRGRDNEWYTLPEGLYRMYIATGDERYKDFAGVWHYDGYWDAMRAGDAAAMTGLHGYSHVNVLGGAAMAYRVTGEQKYLDAAAGAYELFQKHQLLASGGYALSEALDGPDGSNYLNIEVKAASFEVPCSSWAVFKLARHLISLTGRAKYGQWAEAILYNAMGGALPMKSDSFRRGKTFYYADYRIGGGRKSYYGPDFPCCSGTYPQALAEILNMTYYLGEDCLYIAQYLPSRLSAKVGGAEVTVSVTGDYPETDNFNIQVDGAGAFKLALRVPAWTKNAGVSLNGKALGLAVIPGEWAVIDRVWAPGDVVNVTFPMRLTTFPITKDHPERAAILYGPVMLAAEGERWAMSGDAGRPDSLLVRKDGLLFEGRDKNGGTVLFKPYYAYAEREWYTVYMDFEA